MSSNVRTILIIVVFALVTIWLFYDPRRPAVSAAGSASAAAQAAQVQAEQAPVQAQSCMADKRCGCNANNSSDSSSIESYDSIEGFDSEASNEASFDSASLDNSDMIEGYHNLSGSVLEIEPTQSANSRGVSYFPYKRINRVSDNASFQIPDHTDAQRAGYLARLKGRMQAETGLPVDISAAQATYADAGQTIRNVTPATSMSDAMYTGDRVFDSNNINGECTGVYTNEIYAMSAGANANVDESEQTGLIQPPHMPTYIEVDESSGSYNMESAEQNIDFADLNNTVRKYRSATMADILNGKETDGSIRADNKFYDKWS